MDCDGYFKNSCKNKTIQWFRQKLIKLRFVSIKDGSFTNRNFCGLNEKEKKKTGKGRTKKWKRKRQLNWRWYQQKFTSIETDRNNDHCNLRNIKIWIYNEKIKQKLQCCIIFPGWKAARPCSTESKLIVCYRSQILNENYLCRS